MRERWARPRYDAIALVALLEKRGFPPQQRRARMSAFLRARLFLAGDEDRSVCNAFSCKGDCRTHAKPMVCDSSDLLSWQLALGVSGDL